MARETLPCSRLTAVVVRGEAQREHGEAELLSVVSGILPAQTQEVLPREPQLRRNCAEVLLHERRRKALVARGDGSMRGEDVRRPDRLPGLVEGELVLLHEQADPLEAEEGGVALVHVHAGRGDAQGPEGPDAPDPEEDLLLDARLPVPPVQGRGDEAQVRRVRLDVGVQEVQGVLPDLHLPDPRGGFLRSHLHGDGERAPVPVAAEGDGHVVPVVLRVGLLLEAVEIQVLLEIALAIEKPHAHQGEPEVRGDLQVITGEHPQAARVHGQRHVKTVFHGEIGDGPVDRALVPAFGGEVALELRVHGVQRGQEGIIRGRRSRLSCDTRPSMRTGFFREAIHAS